MTELSKRTGFTTKEAATVMNALMAEFTEQLEEENVISIQGIGAFEVKKKQERVVVNPGTQQRMLVPPKLVVNFRPSSSFKEKMQ